MSKVKYTDWQKIIKARAQAPAVVEFNAGDETIAVEVKCRLPLSDLIAIVNTVVDACCPLPVWYEYDETTPETTVDAHKKVAIEYMESVFRATILRYYTNLDFSSKSAGLEAIWELAGDEDVYQEITNCIQDDLYDLWATIERKLEAKQGAREEIARRVLNVLDRIESVIPRKAIDEFMDVLAQADNLNIDGTDFLRVIGGVDGE